MYLKQLLAGIDCQLPTDDPVISGLCQDSRQVQAGNLFFAYPGIQFDGRNFLNEVAAKGAAAVLLESNNMAPLPSLSIPLIPVANLTPYLGIIAARFYAHPSGQLRVVGITGTNGKTSCTHFLAQCLQQLGEVCGVIGTLGNGLYPHLNEASLTTPDAIELQQLLAVLREQQIKTVLMEVSSHRLAQQRLNGMEFSIAAFTNLTRDHLDYHGCMAEYARAKRSFFELPGVEQAVLNADDPYGRMWLSELAEQLPVTAYAMVKPQSDLKHIPQVVAKHYEFNQSGLRAEITTPWGDVFIENPFLIGKFNLSNLLLALTVLKRQNFSLTDIVSVLSKVKGVQGRMEVFYVPGKPRVVIDYAHTPDALQQALQTLRPYCLGRLYCVFGCGGDRDRGKRAKMASVAEQYADHLIITNDNPRFEDPEQIIQDIQQGLSKTNASVIEPDRRLAILYAIQKARSGDVVLIAGKGHEAYQLIAGIKHPFSDAQEVSCLLHPDKI